MLPFSLGSSAAHRVVVIERGKTLHLAMGKHFGELAKVRGIVQYRLSPFEQRAFAGAISSGVPNMFRRFRSQFFRVVPPFVIAYMVYDQVEKAHKLTLRKNPKDFENDE